jgi:hypothetical protein
MLFDRSLPTLFSVSISWVSLLKIYPPENWPMATTKLKLVLRLKRSSKNQTELFMNWQNLLARIWRREGNLETE